MLSLIKGRTTILDLLDDAIVKKDYKWGLHIFKLCIKAKTNIKFLIGGLSQKHNLNAEQTRLILANFLKSARKQV